MDRRRFLRLASGLVVMAPVLAQLEPARRLWPGFSAARDLTLPPLRADAHLVWQNWVEDVGAQIRSTYQYHGSQDVYVQVDRSGGAPLLRPGDLVSLDSADEYAYARLLTVTASSAPLLGVVTHAPDPDGLVTVQVTGRARVRADFADSMLSAEWLAAARNRLAAR